MTSKACPECGEPNASGRTRCHKCATALPMDKETVTAIGAKVAAEKEAERVQRIATRYLLDNRIITHEMTNPERAAACRDWLRKATGGRNADMQMREANAVARNALAKSEWDDYLPL